MVIVHRSYCNNCQRFIHEEETAHLTVYPTHSISNQAVDEDTFNEYLNSTVSGLDLLIPESGTRTATLSGYETVEEAIIYQTFIDTTLSGLIGQNEININNVSGTATTNYGDISTLSGLVSANSEELDVVSGVVVNNYIEIQGTQTVLSGLIQQNEVDLNTASGYIDQNIQDIITLSGLIDQNASDVSTVSGLTVNNYNDIQTLSGLVDSISGIDQAYVDSQDSVLSGLIDQNSSDISTVSGLLGDYLPLSGGTMSGFITLHDHPVNDYHASTKQYVDEAIEYSSVSGSVADAISSLVQVDWTLGTNLLVTNSGVPLNNITALINGEDFVVGPNYIVMKDPGMYQISWNVVSLQSGTTAIRRRNLVADINQNNVYFPTGSLGGTYSRSSVTSPYMNVGGDYIITTSGENETVAIRTRDLSTESTVGVTYQTAGGYLRIRLVRKD